MLNTYVKVNCKDKNIPIYVSKGEDEVKLTLGTGELVINMSEKKAEELKQKIDLALKK